MDITLYISRFIYRIRHQLVFGTLIITALVAYFSQFLEKKYTVTTSIYTGITSNTGLDDETRPDWQAVNNTILYIIISKLVFLLIQLYTKFLKFFLIIFNNIICGLIS